MNKDRNTFYCFSPPVMIATFGIEAALALYSLWRYKLNAVNKLAVATLLCLATFQLAEFFVCEGAASAALPWSRIGYVAITLLPPLGLHLLSKIIGKPYRALVAAGYAVCASFAAFFLLVPGALVGNVCMGNYVIFHVAEGSGGLLGAYYYTMLAAVFILAWVNRHKLSGAKKQAVTGLVFGYMFFIVPTVSVNIINPETITAIPSIMCGFAVVLALSLAVFVLPNSAIKRRA